jgi:hypothetical protein
MRDDTKKMTRGASRAQSAPLTEPGVPMEELGRRGPRDIPQRAIEEEVEQLLEEMGSMTLLD